MMTVEQIKQLPIKELANDNAYLFLWTTHTYSPECFEILKNWGFKYHLTMTWDKGGGLAANGGNGDGLGSGGDGGAGISTLITNLLQYFAGLRRDGGRVSTRGEQEWHEQNEVTHSR